MRRERADDAAKDLNTGRGQAGAGFVVSVGDDRRSVVINMDANKGGALGHEVGHAISFAMPPEVKANLMEMVLPGKKSILDSDVFEAIKRDYEDRINLRRNADGSFSSVPEAERVSLSDVDAAEEYLAENFSAMLHGLPPGKLGTPLPLVSRLRLSLGAMLEKSGARRLTATDWTGKTTGGEAGGVTTSMGYKPSFAVAQAFDNFLQSGKLESARFPGEAAAPQIHVPGTEPVLEKPTAAPTVSETISNVSEVEPKAPVEGFKKGDPIGEIKDKNGMLIAEEAKISKVLENGMYEIEFTDPDTGKRMRGTADEQSLQSPVAVGKIPRGRDVFYPNPVTTETPAGIARPETVPSSAEIVTPKQVENVVRPEAPSVTKPSASLRPAAAQKFAAKADDSVHRQNRDKLESIMAAPRAEIPAVETDYYAASSPVQSPDATIRETQRRAADAIDAQGKTNPFRTVFQKLFVPYRWSAYKLSPESNARLYGASAERKAGGVYGMSVDKVGQNIDLLRGLALENPKLAQVLSSKGFSDAYLTSNELISDFQKYLNNQAHGFGGGGEQLQRPADTRVGTVTEQAKDFVPAVLPIEKRQLFNLLLNYEQQESRTVGMEYSSRFAKLNGIDPLTIGIDSKGRPLTENNALRAEAMRAGFDPRVLNSAVENLPTENFTTPLKERRDITFPASDVAITQAGFMPEISEGPTRRVQGNDETRKIATDYIKKNNLGTAPHETYAQTNEATLKRIADFYENAKHEPDNPEVVAAYRALADETRAQYDDMVRAGIKIEPYEGKGEPYANSAAMLADVRDNKHLYFFLTDKAFGEGGVSENNALLQKSGISINGHDLLYNDLFRAVHDYFGHTAEGFEFGPRGEYNAYLAHSRMFSDAAKPALAAETLAQNAWVNFGPHLRRTDGSLPKVGDADFVPIAKRRFADQKNTVVPKELLEAADAGATNSDIRFMPEVIKRELGSNLDFANPPTDEQAIKALSSEKKIKFGKARELEEGHQVAARIDIPAFLRDGTYVVAVHEPDGASGGPGKIIGYDTVTRLKNPQFVVKPRVRLIYEGESKKFPVATVDGQIISDRSIPTDLKNWVPVGMDPKEHSFFYDKRTDQPVVSGDESISVGNTVFVKNPVYSPAEKAAFMVEMPLQLQARRKLPHAIEEKELTLVHRSGSAGLESIDPSRFGKSGITPRSERSGEDRSYFYVKGLENKGDLAMNRPNVYEIPVSGKRIYDADTDALNWEGTVNRQKADLMLKDAGYAGVLRTRGEGKKTFKQVELFEEVKTPAQEKTLDDLKDEILNSPRGEKAAERIAKQVGSSSNGEYFDALDAWVEKEVAKKPKGSFMPEVAEGVRPVSTEQAKNISEGNTEHLKEGNLLATVNFMPEIPEVQRLLRDFPLDEDAKKKMEGKTGFAFVSDWADSNRKYVTASGREIDVMRGGFGYTYHPDVIDKGAWAGTFSALTDRVVKKINASDGIGLVVLGGKESSASSRSFSLAFLAEMQDAIASKELKRKDADRLIAKAFKSLDRPEIKTLDDYAALIPKERNVDSPEGLTFEQRELAVREIGSAANSRSLGLPNWNDVLRKYNVQKGDYQPGQIVSVVQFEKGKPAVRSQVAGTAYHPSYEAVLLGKPIGMLTEKVMIGDFFKDFFAAEGTEPASFTRKVQTKMPEFTYGEGFSVLKGRPLEDVTLPKKTFALEGISEPVNKPAVAPLADVTL